MDLTPKQQASEAIRQAESILLVTGQRPNIDQIAGMVALTYALRKLGKKVSPVVTDRVPRGADWLAKGVVSTSLDGLRDFIVRLDVTKAEVDKLKYTVEDGKLNINITPFSGSFNPRDVTFGQGDYHFDLIIALGVPSRSRLDHLFEQNAHLLASTPLLNVDYHRINEQHGAINLVETNSSTLCEMILALTESLQGGLLDDKLATALLLGIMASTDRFAAQHTTAKSLTVAAQMMAMGGDQKRVIAELYGHQQQSQGSDRDRRNGRSEQRQPERAATKPTPAPQPVVRETQPVAPVEAEVTESQPIAQDVREVEALPAEPVVNVDAEIDAFIHGDMAPAAQDDLVYTAPEAASTESLQWDPAADHVLEPGQVSDLPNPGEADDLLNYRP